MALAKCSRCGRMYADDDRSSCYYHPGTHRGNPQQIALTLSGWSCCNVLAADARGCRLAATHTPCPKTAAALARFPQSDVCLPADGARRRGAAEEREPPVVEGVVVDLITHTVTVGESVASIALKYGMRRDQLVKWNKLLTPTVSPGQLLRVSPPPKAQEEPSLGEKLRGFQKQTGSDSIEEARYYVEAAGGNVRAAVRAYEEDGAAGDGGGGGGDGGGQPEGQTKEECCIS